jgi:hypothetical protein
MLRTRVQRRTDSTGVILTVTHGLGTTLDAWNLVDVSARGRGRTYHVNGAVTANTINIANSLNTNVTVDVFCWVYQGRLY